MQIPDPDADPHTHFNDNTTARVRDARLISNMCGEADERMRQIIDGSYSDNTNWCRGSDGLCSAGASSP
jgi:hypothetical protein